MIYKQFNYEDEKEAGKTEGGRQSSLGLAGVNIIIEKA